MGIEELFLGGAGLGMLMGVWIAMMIFGIAAYVYMALALMKIAQRLNVEGAWMAWVPIANLVLMAKIAKMHWWPVLLLIGVWIPILGIIAMIALMVFVYMWMWKICEARGKPGWWAVLQLIPLVGPIWGLIMWGILAWGE